MDDRAPALPADVLSELALIVLSDDALDGVLSHVAELTKKVIEPADEVSVTLAGPKNAHTAAYTGALAMQADERQYALDSGPCLDAGRGGVTLHSEDMTAETRWPDYAPQAVRAGVGSSVSLSLPIQEDVVGALNVYSRQPHAFGDEDIARCETFAAYAAIAVGNAHALVSTAELANHLRVAMESRATIEQAKGVLMAANHCSPDEAFELLVRASQRENIKLRDLAARLVRSAQKRTSN